MNSLVKKTLTGTLTAVTGAAIAAMVAAAPASATPASAELDCAPVPEAPAGYHWSGACFIGPQLSPASQNCATSGQDGVAEHRWSTWRCLGELRSDNLYHYYLYVV
jgi:hypothetical protein